MNILIVIYLWIWLASFVSIIMWYEPSERNFKTVAIDLVSSALWPILLPAKIITTIREL